MFIGLFIACALLIKTSLLGLGGVSILLGLTGVIICALATKVTTNTFTHNNPNAVAIMTHQRLLLARFKRFFLSAMGLHLATYFTLLLKLIFIDSAEDVAAFIVNHLVLHHVVCAVIGAVLTFMAVNLYLHYRKPTEFAL